MKEKNNSEALDVVKIILLMIKFIAVIISCNQEKFKPKPDSVKFEIYNRTNKNIVLRQVKECIKTTDSLPTLSNN